MSKSVCVVEDNFDFWSELNKKDNFILDDSHCLLSKESLGQNHIVLPCGHKFNYQPLCKEIANLKYPCKTYSRQICLNRNQICCPYCRKVFDKLLPKIPLYKLSLPKHVCSDLNSIQMKKCTFHLCEKTNAFDSDYGVLCTKHYTKRSKQSIKKQPHVFETAEQAALFKSSKVIKMKLQLKELNLSTKGLKIDLFNRLISNSNF